MMRGSSAASYPKIHTHNTRGAGGTSAILRALDGPRLKIPDLSPLGMPDFFQRGVTIQRVHLVELSHQNIVGFRSNFGK